MSWTERGPDALPELLDGITASSWRWEAQGDYSAIDGELLARWRAGLGRDPEADRSWIDYVQRLRARGIPFQRVRVLTDPLTEYLRCQLDVSYMNVDQAGEDIRWVEAATARELDMPDYDYYVIDNVLVAQLVFADDGQLGGVRLCRDEDVLQQHRRWRDVIWPYAIPHQEYIAR
ncbi:hypothetical protein LY13_001112 [Prauserella aidingensis]|uniref:DUF6879 family protein n=1 Tax=Prauserella aidingensis TaxID=387890 RepID=UPI0020A42FC6|nr:DUF6879 family protein [Prauserella aidingensis]MCP2252373.1 hypothetical protein [Prauserella aidingensis]